MPVGPSFRAVFPHIGHVAGRDGTSGWRVTAAWVAVVLAALSAGLGIVAWWANATLVNSDGFAARATVALAQDEVNDVLAARLVDQHAADSRLATTARPVAVGLVDAVLETEQFAGVFRVAVRKAHERLVLAGADSAVVAVPGAAPLLDPALHPDGSDIGGLPGSEVVAVVDDPAVVGAAHLLPYTETAALICLVAWLVFSAAALLQFGSPQGLRRLGTGLMVMGAAVGLGLLVVPRVLGERAAPELEGAVSALVQAFTDPLMTAAAVLLGLGAVVVVLTSRTPTSRTAGAGIPVAGAARVLGTAVEVAVVAVVTFSLTAVVLLPATSAPDPPAPDPATAGCNGSTDLCDRRLDQVSMAGSHNAMSTTAEPGWFLAVQQLPVVGQLAAGSRALMLDIYPGYPSGRLVRTDVNSKEAVAAAKGELTPEGQAILDRLKISVGVGPPEDTEMRAYLCHGYCELGATELVRTLADIDDFLTENPNEVVVLILQDYMAGEEVERAMEEAGLLDRVWPLAVGDPMPRLRDMVMSGLTVVVTSENHGGEVPWMPDVYEVAEETPYLFESPDDFTCEPARGGTGKPLFLINHWLDDSESPVAAARETNAREELESRLAMCEERRGRAPNILAVDFVDVGDLVDVIEDVNRSGTLVD